jgi:hypothetical protein
VSDEYKYQKIGTAQYWLEEGWYSVQKLQEYIDAHKRQSKHLENSMKQIKDNHETHNQSK